MKYEFFICYTTGNGCVKNMIHPGGETIIYNVVNYIFYVVKDEKCGEEAPI